MTVSAHKGAGALEWHRSGTMLYTLVQEGYRRGEPVMVNGYTVQISGSPHHTVAETEAMAEQIHAALSCEARPPLPAASGASSGWMTKVKALTWQSHGSNVSVRASTPFGECVAWSDGSWYAPFAPSAYAETMKKAMAAVQADYSARILSALDIPPSVDGLDAGEDRLPRRVAGAAETAQVALEALRKRIQQLDRRSFILTPEGNGVRAVKDACGHWLELHEVIGLFEAAIERASTGEAATDARRDAFMAGRQSVRGINRSYSEQAWQAYLALEGKSNV